MKNSKIKANGNNRMFFIASVLAVIFFVIHLLLTIYTDASPAVSAGVICGIYVLMMSALVIAEHLTSPRKTIDPKLSPLLGQLMVDVVLKLHMPVMICDMSGKIIWYNRTLGSLVGTKETLYGATVDGICPLTVDDISGNKVNDNVILGDRIFSSVGYEIKAGDKDYRLVVFNDTTELAELSKRYSDDDTVIMYIIIDNLGEMLEYLQEKYRSASAEIADILKRWTAESGSMLKEYERDKFIVITDRKSLEIEEEKKFSILDEIRDVRVGDGNLPVTVSVGVAKISGTLAEKAKVAQSALDMALQRGGDQAVLKSDDGIEFFGGRTKTVQKRTKVKARVIANELITHMSSADNILIMGHRYADFDSIGGCVGIARLADFCGVPANIVVDTKDVTVKGCIESFSGLSQYDGRFIDAREGLDMIRSGTMLIIADVNNFAHLESPQIAENADKIAIIDHHRKTAEFSREPLISYIEPSASSCCELISEMLEQTIPAGSLSKEEADMLLAGMLLDTKHFSRNTGTRTFSAAQYLREEGAVPGDVQEFFKTDLNDFVREAKFESDVVIYRKVIAISRCDGEGDSQDRIAAAKAADKLLGISGILASFALVKIDGSVHISARSTGKINVQLILEELKGGGHFDVAGAQVADRTVLEALTMLKSAIDNYMDNNK